MQNYMLVILAPIGFGLFAITPSLIHVLFNHKWDAGIPGDANPVDLHGAWWDKLLARRYLQGGGQACIRNKLAIYKAVLLVPTLWWAASNYGLEGVAWGQLGVRLVAVVVDIVVVSRFVNITLAQNVRYIWPPMLAAIIMASVLEVFFLVDPARESLLVMVAAIILGAGIYGACIWLFDRDTVARLWELGLTMLGRGRAERPRLLRARLPPLNRSSVAALICVETRLPRPSPDLRPARRAAASRDCPPRERGGRSALRLAQLARRA